MNAQVIHLSTPGWSDAALVEAARVGNKRAQREIVERYAQHVAGVLVNTLGASTDLSDHVQETFLEIFKDLHSLRDTTLLKAWITQVAVHRALHVIRAKKRKWWLRFVTPEELPEPPSRDADADQMHAIRATYLALDRLGEHERVAFVLRFMHGMSLDEVAGALGVSLATAKRRLAAAEQRFRYHAERDARLAAWVRGGV